MKAAMVKRWAGICELPPEKMQKVIDVIEGDNYAIVPNNDWAAVAKFSAMLPEIKKKIMSFLDGLSLTNIYRGGVESRHAQSPIGTGRDKPEGAPGGPFNWEWE